MSRPRRAEDEEDDDAKEDGVATALGAAATFVRLLPDDDEAAEPEASWLCGRARERCIAQRVKLGAREAS